MELDASRLAFASGVRGFQYIRGSAASIQRDSVHDADWIFHLAANTDIPSGVTDRDADLTATAGLTRDLLEIIADVGGGRLILASSGAVYGQWKGRPFRETDATRPVSLYGAGKVAAEAFTSAYASMFGIDAVILRFGNILGPGMSRGLVRDFILSLRDDPTRLVVRGSGRQRKCFMSLDDTISAMLWAAQLPPRDIPLVVNAAPASSTQVLSVAELVSTALGLSPRITAAGGVSWRGDQEIVQLDVALASQLGWQALTEPGDAIALCALALCHELGTNG